MLFVDLLIFRIDMFIYSSILQYTGDKMDATTIKIHEDTKSELDQYREYKNESYDEVIKKMLYIVKICKKKPELSKETVLAIENARKRIMKGKFLTEEEARKRLGL